MKKKYLIIGNAENTHMLKWVRALLPYFDLYLVSSKTTHPSIQELLPPDHIFDLDLKVSDEGGNHKLLFEYRKIRKIIKTVSPAIVNPHYITSHGFLAALIRKFSRRKFTLVQSAWGSDILVTPFRNRLYRTITKFCLRMAHIATSDSIHMTEVIRSLYPVETLTFSFGLDALPALDPGEKSDFLFYSNRMLSANYNIDEAIRFFHRIVKEEPKAMLIIAHDGSERKSLESLVRELAIEEKVSFCGFVSEEGQVANYQQSRFFISIPTSDATSVSLLEAMAYGCIPVVSDIPANHEWIVHGENGIVYNTGITGIKEILTALEQKEEIAGRNREIILKRAIFPDSIRKYVDHLNSMNI